MRGTSYFLNAIIFSEPSHNVFSYFSGHCVISKKIKFSL
jgi:hypothetical protein